MFTRTIWFGVGAVAGAGAAAYGFVRFREVTGALAPDQVAGTVVGTARTLGRGAVGAASTASDVAASASGSVRDAVRDAWVEGRREVDDAERRIIAELDRRDRRRRPSDRGVGPASAIGAGEQVGAQ